MSWVGPHLAFVVATLVVAGGAGCNSAPDAFACTSSTTCTSNGTPGTCESSGFCSFPDPSCSEGRRYGEFSGPASNQCVGQIDDAGVPDATSCGSASLPNDLDCDGILDGQDNCPSVSNPKQDNEDGDRFGDACDPCPPVADNNPVDSDSDGVADACDPNPNTPGDKIVMFEGFNRDNPAWTKFGTWTVTGGNAESTPSGNTYAHLGVMGPTTGKETISASVTVTAAASPPSDVDVIDENQVTGDPGVACQVSDDATQVLRLIVNGSATSIAEAAYSLTVNATYLIKLHRDGTSYSCHAENGAAVQTVSGTSALTSSPFLVGVRVFSAGARFHWMMTVSSP